MSHWKQTASMVSIAPTVVRDGETTIKTKVLLFEGGGGRALRAERKIVQNAAFRGKNATTIKF